MRTAKSCSALHCVIPALVVLSVSTLALLGQNASYRPGTTDPAGNPSNFTLFRNQQVFVMSPGTKADPWQTGVASFDANLNPMATVANLPWSSAIPFDQVDIQALSGRIVHPDKDDIVIVQRSESDATKLAVRFRDGSGETTLGTLPQRLQSWTDFFATSVGDLDRLYDPQGNYHDEVVTAWMEQEPNPASGNCLMSVPHVAVLNYNNGATPSVLTQSIDRDEGQYVNICTLLGYDYLISQGQPMQRTVPQPVDNIIATAIGDFDGDGYNELAVAYMRGTAGMVISVVIYRYQNDGANASLTPVNTIEMYRPDRSMVGTLSLAAGDFDGSGVDQLLVGSAYWWGTPAADNSYQSDTFQTQPVFFLIKGGQAAASVTGASSTATDNASTEFFVSLGNGAYVPRKVTLTGGVGNWAAINGTWSVTLTANGFSIPVDSSSFGSFGGQTVQFTAAAPLTQADSAEVSADPLLAGPLRIGDADTDGRIRVQMVPGLFHFDPNNGFDFRRRQIAVLWNMRPSSNSSASNGPDTHLGIIQVTNDDKLTLAVQQSDAMNQNDFWWQTYQTTALAAGAFRGDNAINDPTWSLFLSGVGAGYNRVITSNPPAEGAVTVLWKVAPDPSDPGKLQLTRGCAGIAAGEQGRTSPTTYGIDDPICQIWGDSAIMDSPTGPYPFHANNYLRLPAIAADLNGNSLRLGAPMHFEITNPGKADFILEQPPQHTAWLDLGSGPQVVTINRYPTFNTAMEDSQKKDFASKNQDHLDWIVGGSVELTAQQTTTVGVKSNFLGTDLEATDSQKLSASAKVAYDYNNVSSNYDSGYDAYTVGRGAVTGQDDSLILESQILDLWRYRVYGEGTSTGDPNRPNQFYEIVLPGPSLLSNPGGRDVDWYQPIHEVGNILSYPGRADVCSPSDIGPITISNTSISNQVIPLISCSQQFYNGNSSTLSLMFEHQTGKGNSTDYTHKLHADVNLSYTNTATISAAGTGSKTKFGVNVDVHGGADWGHLSTSKNSTTDATGITLNSPQGDSDHAYPYYPIFYDTISGALKVAYGIGDITSSAAGGGFWKQNYAQKPDPALNLPNRFAATYSDNGVLNGWEPETTITRKRMKGFVVRNATKNPLTNDYPLLGSNPQDGDTIMLEGRVYNYSISATPTGPITVQFSVIAYDGGTDNEICNSIPTTGKGGRVCPASARTIIGTGSSAPTGGVQTISLTARENAQVYLIWNTKGFGPKGAGVNEYRVYVDLLTGSNGQGELYPPEPPCTAVPCEDDYGNEKILDPGQNNEGWSLIAVAAPKPNLLGADESDALSVATRETLSAESSAPNTPQALSATETGATNKTPFPAYLFQPLHIRLTAFSNAVSTLYGNVTISDGKPASNAAKTIAIKTLLGIRPLGSSVWFDWTPLWKGTHHLYAVIQNTDGTKPLGDLLVQVSRAPGDLNEDGRVDRHDLNMLNRDIGKTVAESACGADCDLDGDGAITGKDADLMDQLCDSRDCAFGTAEYVGGGASPLEPDMRAIRSADEAVSAAYLVANPEDADFGSNASAGVTEPQLYQAELQRKQGLRSIRYYYKGKCVTAGPYAQWQAATAKGTGSSSR